MPIKEPRLAIKNTKSTASKTNRYPSCGAPLWKVEDEGEVRFRCHAGHAFTAASLLSAEADKIEETLCDAAAAGGALQPDAMHGPRGTGRTQQALLH